MCPGGAVVADPIALIKRGLVHNFAVAGAALTPGPSPSSGRGEIGDPALAVAEGYAGGQGVVCDFDFESIDSGLLGFGVVDIFPADDAALIPLPPSPSSGEGETCAVIAHP